MFAVLPFRAARDGRRRRNVSGMGSTGNGYRVALTGLGGAPYVPRVTVTRPGEGNAVRRDAAIPQLYPQL
jgi:hypothetical protein